MTLRCEWAGNDPLMQKYHDEEWGTPKRDDRRLFEDLVLDGAQATFSISSVTGLIPTREAVLYGSAGTLRFANDKLYGGQCDDESLHEIVIPSEENGYWRVEEEFINAIRGLEGIKFMPFETGLKYMAFTEAVARSMAASKMIDLGSIT